MNVPIGNIALPNSSKEAIELNLTDRLHLKFVGVCRFNGRMAHWLFWNHPKQFLRFWARVGGDRLR